MANELDDVTSPTPAPSGTPPPSAAGPGGGAGAASGAVAAPVAASPATTPAMPQTQRDTTLDNRTVPNGSAPADSWGAKLYHGVLGALGGSSDYALARDPQTGKMVVTATKSGPGQQWKRIISGGLAGLAASGNRGTGPGSNMRGLSMGIDAGKQQAQQQDQQKRQDANEDYDAQQKAATTNAQHSLLTHQIAESSWRLTHEQTEATQADTDRENTMNKLVGTGDASDAGFFPHFQSIVELAKEFPQVHDMQARGELTALTHVGADGKIDGIHLYHTPPSWASQPTAAAVPIETKSIGPDGKMVTKTLTVPPGGMKNGDLLLYIKAQNKESLDEHHVAVQEKLEAQKQKDLEDRQLHENRASDASAANSYAAAGEHRANAAKANAVASGGGDAAVDQIGRGQMELGSMAYLLSRNPAMADAVAAKYPGFDTSKVKGYANAYKEFTSLKNGMPGQALNAGATVLKHLRRLSQLNTRESHIPGTPDYTAYQNQLGTLVPELGRFYGNDTIPGLADYRKTLGAQMPGSRQRAIETQAHAMGEKFDSFVQSWRNAAPSAVYEAKMPGIDPEAIAALQELNPKYSESKTAELINLRAGQELTQKAAPQQAGPQAGAPTGSIGQIKGSDGQMYWTSNGKTGDLGVAQ